MADVFTKLREIFPANRVAAISLFLTALSGQILTLAGAFGDTDIAQALVITGGFLAQAATVVKFLSGAQKSEALENADTVQVLVKP